MIFRNISIQNRIFLHSKIFQNLVLGKGGGKGGDRWGGNNSYRGNDRWNNDSRGGWKKIQKSTQIASKFTIVTQISSKIHFKIWFYVW